MPVCQCLCAGLTRTCIKLVGTKDQNAKAAAEATRVLLIKKNAHNEQQDPMKSVANASCASAPKPYLNPACMFLLWEAPGTGRTLAQGH